MDQWNTLAAVTRAMVLGEIHLQKTTGAGIW